MYYGKAWMVMEENHASMGHMTGYCRHVTEEKGNESMESHGRSWKFQGKENVYNYHSIANQASNILVSDFLCSCVFLLV
jgi:hypothetical protein